ncbi:MAG: translation elongation factor Ts [Candidatus Izimaplasma sp.]|nr:translation elongation factor Ts [Candidatus Izimaplasma bacterium]
MAISAKLVKELRDKTGAGLMDCKKALVQNDGDLDKAVDWLREKGISKAEKKASRIAAEGIAEVKTLDNKAIIFELNCETDFVAKNDNFKALVKKISDALIASDKADTESALEIEVDGKPLKDLLLEQTATIGEKITFRRYDLIKKTTDQVFGSYIHMGGSIASLVVLNNGDEEMARNIAMHIAASSPKYISRDDIADDFIEHEKEVLTKQALNENAESDKPKPENIIAKMVIGRLNKYFKEICLLSQPYVKNPDETVKNYLKSQGASIALFKRLAVGEGIEKKEENFAEEVRKQSS